MLCNKSRWLIHSGKQKLMLCLLNWFVKEQNQCRENGYAADNTNDNAFCHNNTKVTSKGKGHNTKCNKAGNRCNGASCYRLEGICNGMTHGPVFLTGETLLILFIAVEKENGIVHCYTKLKDCSKCLRNIGGLSQYNIAAQVIEDCQSDTEQEQEGNNEGSACQLQNDQAEHSCDHNINRQLLHGNILNIRNNTCHTTKEALLIGNLTKLCNGFHGIIGGCGIIKQYQHHGGVAIDKYLSVFLRNHFHRKGDICHIIIPENILNMLYLAELILQLLDILHFHIFHDYHGKGAHSKLIHQNILPLYSFKGIRQVT